MSKGTFSPELPCERLVRRICGKQWRSLSDTEKDGAWGIAIVKSILDGVNSSLEDISLHLGVRSDNITRAWRNLSLNGALLRSRIRKDNGLIDGDRLAWCFYAGYASGLTGPVRIVG